jgi:hypothetical protein
MSSLNNPNQKENAPKAASHLQTKMGYLCKSNNPLQKAPIINVIQVPPATSSQIIGESVRQAAQQRVHQINEGVRQQLASNPRVAAAAKKALDTTDEITKMKTPYVKKMQSYLKRYKDTINYSFKKKYDYESYDLEGYQRECALVEEMVNGKDAPAIIRAVIGNVAELFEYFGAEVVGHPFFNNRGSADLIRAKLEEGMFDDDIEQCAIEMSFYFNQPWFARMAFKMAQLEFETMVANRPRPQGKMKPVDSKMSQGL